MAYQLFAKPQQSKSPPTNVALSNTSSNKQNKSPVHTPPVVLPQSSLITATKMNHCSPARDDSSNLHPKPYPHPISSRYPTPHPNITIEPVNTGHIASLTRITGLLLPIRYPSSFYTAIITDPVIASLSRVAIYHDHPTTATASVSEPTSTRKSSPGTDKVIGGIRCRLERQPQCLGLKGAPEEPANLYIQTLHLLSPYRGNGVATSLLTSLLFASPESMSSELNPTTRQVSDLVKHYNIRTVTAHVHEANDEALDWYRARGFEIEDGVIDGYYRRLKPSGAKLVKLTIHWKDGEGQRLSFPKQEELSENEAPLASQEEDSYSKEEEAVSNKDEDDDWEKVEVEDGFS